MERVSYTKEDVKELIRLADEFTKGNNSPEAQLLRKVIRRNSIMVNDSICDECRHIEWEEIIDKQWACGCEECMKQFGMTEGCYLFERSANE